VESSVPIRRERIPHYFPCWATSDGKIYIDHDEDGVGKLLKPHKSKAGVWQVNILRCDPPGTENEVEKKRTKVSVARLICLTFHGEQPPTVVARHRDPSKPKDNSVGNVYWKFPETWVFDEDDYDNQPLPIPHFPGYSTSRDGRVLDSKKMIVVPQSIGAGGTPVVHLRVDGKRTMRSVANLVAQTWLGNPPDGYGESKAVFAKHKDGNKLNNAASNLYWHHPGLTAIKKPTEGVSSNGK